MRSPASQFRYIVLLSVGFVACAVREPVAEQYITVTELESPAGANSAEPFLSYSDKTNLMLSWLEREADSSGVSLRLSSLDAAGKWSEPAEVVKANDLFVNWADFPSVVPLASGKLLAHWLQRNGTGRYSYDVRLAESADGGRTWSKSVTPHAPGIPAEHGFVTLLPRPDSSADVFFLNGSPAPADKPEGRGPPMTVAHAQWTGAGAVASRETTLDERACDCCQTAAALTTRGPVALYRDRSEKENRDISVTRFVDGSWTPPVPLHTDGWVIDACPVNGPAISAIGDRIAAVWFTGARDTAKVQLVFSTDAGKSFGPPIRIDAGQPAGRIDVELLDGGDALVTWIERTSKDSSEVRARVVRADGTPRPSVTISPLTGGRATGFPRMARRRDDVVLAWTQPGSPSRVRIGTLRIAPR